LSISVGKTPRLLAVHFHLFGDLLATC